MRLRPDSGQTFLKDFYGIYVTRCNYSGNKTKNLLFFRLSVRPPCRESPYKTSQFHVFPECFQALAKRFRAGSEGSISVLKTGIYRDSEPRSLPRRANQSVPRAPKAKAVARVRAGLWLQSIAPLKAATETTTSRRR